MRATRHRAAEAWDDFLRGDEDGGNGAFPFLRRRGPAGADRRLLRGPDAPLMATGRLGKAQLTALDSILAQLAGADAFRVLLVHHPLHSTSRVKRLTDSRALRALIRQHGVDLVLHGHDHIHSTTWLEGPGREIPAIGVPSASSIGHGHYPAAAFNLFSIAREDGRWRCEQTMRAIDRDMRVKQIRQVRLI